MKRLSIIIIILLLISLVGVSYLYYTKSNDFDSILATLEETEREAHTHKTNSQQFESALKALKLEYNDLQINLEDERADKERRLSSLNREIQSHKTEMQRLQKLLDKPLTDDQYREYYEQMKYYENEMKLAKAQLSIQEQQVDSLQQVIFDIERHNQRMVQAITDVFKNTSEIKTNLLGIDDNIRRFGSGAKKFDIAKETNENVDLIKDKLEESEFILDKYKDEYEWAKSIRQEFENMRIRLTQKEEEIKKYDKKFNTVYYYVGSMGWFNKDGHFFKIKMLKLATSGKLSFFF